MDKLEAQLAKAEKVLGLIDSEYITQPELEDVVALIIASIETSSEDFQKKMGEMSDSEAAYYAQCSKAIEDCKAYLEDKLTRQYNYMAKVNTKDVQDAIEQTVAKIQVIQGERGEQGIQGVPGKDGKDGSDGSPDTPDQVIDKVNLAAKLIKKERVEGLADIERMAKANAEFNPTMGPSFADLENIKKTVKNDVTINYIIDGGGSAITTGVKGFVEIPYNMRLTGWQVFGDQVGSIVVDVWKSDYAGFPPVVGGSIAGSEKPTLSSAQSNQNQTLSTWSVGLLKGDILGYNVSSITTVTRVTVSLIGTKT